MIKMIRQFHGSIYIIPLLLFAVDAALSLYEQTTGVAVKARFTFFSLGVTAGWISFATGVVALFSMRKNELAAGLFFIHGFINSIALLVLSAFWTKEMKSYPIQTPQILPVVLLKWLMIAILASGTYLGKKAIRKISNN